MIDLYGRSFYNGYVMKIRNRLIMVAILSSLIILTILGGLSVKQNKKPKPEPEVDPEPLQVDVMPDSFLGQLDDPYSVPDAVMKVITDYMDAYYKSIYTLELEDCSELFSNEMMADISNKAHYCPRVVFLSNRSKKFSSVLALPMGTIAVRLFSSFVEKAPAYLPIFILG